MEEGAGREEEGGTEGRGGWGLARQQQPRLQPPAGSLTRSLARGARRPPPGSRLPAAPAPGAALWRGSGSGGRDRATGRPSSGRPPKQVGGVAGTARTRSRDARGAQGDGGWGLRSRGGGFAAPRLTFHRLRGSPLPCSVRAAGAEFGAGRKRMPGRGRTPGGPGRTLGARREQARALWPQSGRSARGGEDPSAAARCGAVVRGGRSSPPGVWGLPAPSRPEPPWARLLRAVPRAPFVPGSRRGACGARPGSPPGPAERLSAAKPQSEPCALFAFWRRETERILLSFFLIPSPRFSSGKSGTRTAPWVDFPDVPPSLRGDPSFRS